MTVDMREPGRFVATLLPQSINGQIVNAENGQLGAQLIQVESSRLIPLLVALTSVALCVAGIGLGISFGAKDTAARAERESRLQRLETDELKAAVVRAGIKVHLETDSP